jgi:hypothetical protein
MSLAAAKSNQPYGLVATSLLRYPTRYTDMTRIIIQVLADQEAQKS